MSPPPPTPTPAPTPAAPASTATPAPAPTPASTPTPDAAPTPRNTRVLVALLRKELRVELRSFEAVPAMTLFSVTTLVLFHFALSRNQLSGDLASGVLWVTLLFAAVLGINRLFVSDAEQGGFDGFLLSPAERSVLLYAKALTLLAYLAVLELVAVPAFALLLLGPPLWPALPGLALVLALGDLGIVVVGTLVGALAVRTSVRDLLGPMISLPLLVPVLLCAARASSPLLGSAGVGALPPRWLVTLALYDLVFGLITFAVFDFLLED